MSHNANKYTSSIRSSQSVVTWAARQGYFPTFHVSNNRHSEEWTVQLKTSVTWSNIIKNDYICPASVSKALFTNFLVWCVFIQCL